MPPYSHGATCNACQACLMLTATHEEAPRTETTFRVRCPSCGADVSGEIPVAVSVSSLQVVWYERPAS